MPPKLSGARNGTPQGHRGTRRGPPRAATASPREASFRTTRKAGDARRALRRGTRAQSQHNSTPQVLNLGVQETSPATPFNWLQTRPQGRRGQDVGRVEPLFSGARLWGPISTQCPRRFVRNNPEVFLDSYLNVISTPQSRKQHFLLLKIRALKLFPIKTHQASKKTSTTDGGGRRRQECGDGPLPPQVEGQQAGLPCLPYPHTGGTPQTAAAPPAGNEQAKPCVFRVHTPKLGALASPAQAVLSGSNALCSHLSVRPMKGRNATPQRKEND